MGLRSLLRPFKGEFYKKLKLTFSPEALVLSSNLFFVKFMSRSVTKNKIVSMVKDTDLKFGVLAQ